MCSAKKQIPITKTIGKRSQVKRNLSLQENNRILVDSSSEYKLTLLEFLQYLKKQNISIDIYLEYKWLKIKFSEIVRMAKSENPILLLGETGSGKEVLSRLIHFLSERRDKPFFPTNCSSFSEELLYSELFGHEKGSFTGAERKRLGMLKSAEKGSIFLDEIQSSSKAFQNSLLRFFEYKEVKALGSDKIEKADVRVIAASSEPLEKLMNEGKFLKPFFYRISYFKLGIPPLRERDVEAYIFYFFEKINKELGTKEKEISEEAIEYMKRYTWPGNFRELKSVIQNIVLISKDNIIKINDLPEEIKNAIKIKNILQLSKPLLKERSSIFKKEESPSDLTLNNAIKNHIQKVLAFTQGNKSKAARLLGIPLTTFVGKMKKIGIN